MRRLVAAALLLTTAGCAKKAELNRSVSMGDRLDPPPSIADVPVHGHTVTVEARARDVTGELLGLDASSVWVLETDDSDRARPVAIPRREVRQVGVVVYDAGTTTTAAWAVAGTLSTLSHGVFLIFSAPVWGVAGVGTTVDEGLSNDIEVGRRSIDALSQYARFPQGMTPDILRALTRPLRRPDFR